MQRLPKFSQRNDSDYQYILRELESWSHGRYPTSPELNDVEVESNVESNVEEIWTESDERSIQQLPNLDVSSNGL